MALPAAQADFQRHVTLPGQADEDGQADAERIEASLHNGVLTVRVPKSERAQARRIEVKAA
jgi:HSP20 family molecular chaperone IbpA